MNLKNKKIGIAFTGSFYTFSKVLEQMKLIKKKGANIIPIMSENSYYMDTKFGKAEDFIRKIELISNNKIIHTIQDAEKIGPYKILDILAIIPCSRKYNC